MNGVEAADKRLCNAEELTDVHSLADETPALQDSPHGSVFVNDTRSGENGIKEILDIVETLNVVLFTFAEVGNVQYLTQDVLAVEREGTSDDVGSAVKFKDEGAEHPDPLMPFNSWVELEVIDSPHTEQLAHCGRNERLSLCFDVELKCLTLGA